MTTEELYAAALAVELPECPCCKGLGMYELTLSNCPMCDGTGRKGGDEAIRLHNALKAELEHHWKHYSKLDPAKSRSYDRRRRSHAAAIARIAGYLGVE